MLDADDKKMCEDFLATLREDSKDEYFGHLFKYIQRVMEATLSLGKERYSPVMSLTLYARDSGAGDIELVFRPEVISSAEIHLKLKLDQLSGELKTAVNNYGREVWGMNVFNEKESMRETMRVSNEAMIACGHLLKTVGRG